MYNKKDKSIPQKVVLLTLEVVIILLSYWILFAGGYHKIFPSSAATSDVSLRNIIIFSFNAIVFIRICFTMFLLVKRAIPWEEVFSIPVAFGLYYIGFAILGYHAKAEIDLIDGFAIALFLFGSYINSASEVFRDLWKKKPENKGKLYTKGLFRYAMHINYFGDLLWVSAYAIITRNWYSALIPLLLFFFFAFFNIPLLDKHLASKYKEQFDEYKGKTKKLIPFVF